MIPFPLIVRGTVRVLAIIGLAAAVWYCFTHLAVTDMRTRRCACPAPVVHARAHTAQLGAVGSGYLVPVMLEAPVSADTPGEGLMYRKGVLKVQRGAPAAVVIAHGFMCTKDDVAFLRTMFSPYHVLAFDFRAHGDDIVGQCCSFGKHETQELIAAVNMIKSHPETRGVPVIIYGFSMGAVTTLLAQAADPHLAQALILDSPFESTDMVIHRLVDLLSLSCYGNTFYVPGRCFLKKYIYQPWVQDMVKAALKAVAYTGTNQTATCIEPVCPLMWAHRITAPTLCIASSGDDKAPVTAVRSLYDELAGYKRFWITPGRCHFDSFFYQPERYMYEVQKFIHDVLTGEYTQAPHAHIIDDTTAKGVI